MAERMPGFFDVDERLADLSAKGDDLERVKALVDFEIFRPVLACGSTRGSPAARSRVHVQGPDPASDAFSVGLAANI
jgi:IS5 family transposase